MDANVNAIADLFGAITLDNSHAEGPSKFGNNAAESEQLGRMSLEAGKYAEAIAHFQKAVEQSEPGDVKSRIDLAGALEATDQFSSAYRQYIRALALKSDAVEPHIGLADLLQRHGRTTEAIGALQKALEAEPNNPFFNLKISEALRTAGFPVKAMEFAVNAVVAKPDDSYLHYWVGDILIQLKQYPEALQSLRASVELSPGDDYLYLRCAVAFWLSDMKVEAIKAVRLASDLEPEKNVYHGLLEELLRATGQDAEAELEVERARQMDRFDEDQVERVLREMGFDLA
jgi:tetratricopeptide (TPR) repeat protein